MDEYWSKQSVNRYSSSSNTDNDHARVSNQIATRREKPAPLLLDSSHLKLHLPVKDSFLKQRPRHSLEELRGELEKLEEYIVERRLDTIVADCEQFVRIPNVVEHLPTQVQDVEEVSVHIKKRLGNIRAQIKGAHTNWKRTEEAFRQQQLVSLETVVQQVASLNSTDDVDAILQETSLERASNLYEHISQTCKALVGYAIADQMNERLIKIQNNLSDSIIQKLRSGLRTIYTSNNVQHSKSVDHVAAWDVLILYYQIFKQIGKSSIAHTLLISEYLAPYLSTRLSLKSYAEKRVATLKKGEHPLPVLLDEAYEALLDQLTPIIDEDPQLLPQVMWPQFLRGIQEKMPFLFSLEDLDRFSEHYQLVQQWLLKRADTSSRIKCIKDSTAANALRSLIRHWPLDQYFEARFNEITEMLETAILKSNQMNISNTAYDKNDKPILPVTSATLTLIELCWSNRVNLPPLMARFWKLSCQLMLRYGAWLLEWCSEASIRTTIENEKQIKIMGRTMSPVRRIPSRNATSSATSPAVSVAGVATTETFISDVQSVRKQVTEMDIDWVRGQLVDLLQLTVRPAIPESLQSQAVQFLGR
ncbi:hypothetical protein BDF19DRAFT_455059 [Syncephalis fuscata]|nr:hypothetical protein BDF19DRAFT_455059 [Syncephalis fuscata]